MLHFLPSSLSSRLPSSSFILPSFSSLPVHSPSLPSLLISLTSRSLFPHFPRLRSSSPFILLSPFSPLHFNPSFPPPSRSFLHFFFLLFLNSLPHSSLFSFLSTLPLDPLSLFASPPFPSLLLPPPSPSSFSISSSSPISHLLLFYLFFFLPHLPPPHFPLLPPCSAIAGQENFRQMKDRRSPIFVGSFERAAAGPPQVRTSTASAERHVSFSVASSSDSSSSCAANVAAWPRSFRHLEVKSDARMEQA